MAKSKILAVKDLRAHFFMSIVENKVDAIYYDDIDNGAGLGAAFSSMLEEDERFFNIMSAAFLTVLETKAKKEKYTSKKSNIVPKKTASKLKK